MPSLEKNATHRCLVLAHHHPNGKLRPDTVDVISALSTVMDAIYVVSTHLNQEEVSKIGGWAQVIVRDNVGYDFYSYREGILQIASQGMPAQVTLMNTSLVVLQPEKLLSAYFSLLDRLPNSPLALGLTRSMEHQIHLQSFLLSFNAELFNQAFFLDWWTAMTPISERQQVIEKYELGFSRYLQQHQIELRAAYAPYPKSTHSWFEPGLNWFYKKILRIPFNRHQTRLNPMNWCAEDILHEFGVLKMEFLKSNPYGINTQFLKNQIDRHPEYSTYIQAALETPASQP
mgnify:CR=1 FL=1